MPKILTLLLPRLQEHRHSYVKKNAVLAIYMIYKQFEALIPDAPELIFNFLSSVCPSHPFFFHLHVFPKKK
jgi:coatomer subunit beta